MSGFSPDWLALREPADHAARNKDIAAELAVLLAGKEKLSILDLGCGAGSNLRGMVLSLPAQEQSWTLVDYDPRLLQAARTRLQEWADRVVEAGETLVIHKAGKHLTIGFRQADLVADRSSALEGHYDLVTAAALFDLISARWINLFARDIAARGLNFHTVLTYNGEDEWAPPHPRDEAVISAFHAHMGRDKGFGPAAGPLAAASLIDAFRNVGYAVTSGDSPWIVTDEQADLRRELASGIAGAVRETGHVEEADLADWLAFHTQSGSRCLVGHADILAVPKRD
jgi:SAM-dependent methyltransferase